MSREIRRVTKDWRHPERNGNFLPMFDTSFREASAEWEAAKRKWDESEREEYLLTEDSDPELTFEEWHGGFPMEEYYRPYWEKEDATWYQMYQTVSEGTPVTPSFATLEELENYLVLEGTFWDQEDGSGGWDRKVAHAFIKAGFAPSFVVCSGKLYEPRDGLPE